MKDQWDRTLSALIDQQIHKPVDQHESERMSDDGCPHDAPVEKAA